MCRLVLFVLALGAALFPFTTPADTFNLNIRAVGKTSLISWPTAATNYVLQSTIGLQPPSWLAVANPVVAASNTNTVTYTNNSQTRYFRLFLDTTPTGFFLSITRSNQFVIVSWPTNATNFILQTTIGLAPPSWSAVTNVPVVIGSTNFVTYTNNSSTRYFRLSLVTNAPVSPFAGMVLIPAGPFTMGNATSDSDITDAATASVNVSAFYIDTNLVSYALWTNVYAFAVAAGYGFNNAGAAKGPNHPVHSLDWYDTVKWCNARSQMFGLTAVYYTDAGLTLPYTNGETDAIFANWNATGYRLPTEAEWEKAARGGVSGQRFPWGNFITNTLANYFGSPTNAPGGGYSYDLGPYSYNPAFTSGGVQPYTSPVATFPANGYGLNDMVGNLQEWCWDWYGTPYAGGTDPHGPASGPNRVSRGGNWQDDASVARVASRGPYSSSTFFAPNNAFNWFGFRTVKAH